MLCLEIAKALKSLRQSFGVDVNLVVLIPSQYSKQVVGNSCFFSDDFPVEFSFLSNLLLQIPINTDIAESVFASFNPLSNKGQRSPTSHGSIRSIDEIDEDFGLNVLYSKLD